MNRMNSCSESERGHLAAQRGGVRSLTRAPGRPWASEDARERVEGEVGGRGRPVISSRAGESTAAQGGGLRVGLGASVPARSR